MDLAMVRDRAPLDVPDGWMLPVDAAKRLGVATATVCAWAGRGKLAGSVRDRNGHWLVRRAEVDRLFAEREAAAERRAARWTPILDRPRPNVVARPRCEAFTLKGVRCTQPSVGPAEVRGRTVELCAPHTRQSVNKGVTLEPPLVSQRWWPEEDAYLRANPEVPLRVAVDTLGRNPGSVKALRQKPRRDGQG